MSDRLRTGLACAVIAALAWGAGCGTTDGPGFAAGEGPPPWINRPLFLQAGGGNGSGGAAGGASAGSAGSGGPSQSPAAPRPDAGPPPPPDTVPLPPLYGPLDGYFAAKKKLEQAAGTVPRLALDLTSQTAVAGPDEFTAMVWRYDFGILQNLWPGARLDLDVRGGEGSDVAGEIGSTFNTNQYADTPTRGFVLHLWVEQKLWDDQLTLRGGKLDLGDWMDVNRFGYYNFLGFSQNHNPAIPFPGNPLAAMVTLEPKDPDWLYVSAGAGNAEQSSLRIGFDELRDGRSSVFAMAEVGLKVNVGRQPGVYRFIGWYDGRDLPALGDSGGDTAGSDGRWGVALSFDQNLTADLGLFARYGFADQSEFNPRHYWQAGFSWKGLVPGRPRDDLAAAVAQNLFARRRGEVVPDAAGSELYVEAYYNVVVYDWLQVQPFVQYLGNPGGIRGPADGWILGVHVAYRF